MKKNSSGVTQESIDKISELEYKNLSLKVALGHFLIEEVTPQEWNLLNDDDAAKRIEYIVWEPFAGYPLNEVVSMISDLAYSIEINFKV